MRQQLVDALLDIGSTEEGVAALENVCSISGLETSE
jgi:hypothetical protein